MLRTCITQTLLACLPGVRFLAGNGFVLIIGSNPVLGIAQFPVQWVKAAKRETGRQTFDLHLQTTLQSHIRAYSIKTNVHLSLGLC